MATQLYVPGVDGSLDLDRRMHRAEILRAFAVEGYNIIGVTFKYGPLMNRVERTGIRVANRSEARYFDLDMVPYAVDDKLDRSNGGFVDWEPNIEVEVQLISEVI